MDKLRVFMFRINLHLAKQRANCKNNDPQLIFTCSMSTLEKRVKYVQS